MQSYAAPPAYPAGLSGPGDRAQPILYTVPSVGVVGPARIGAAVSAGFMLLPCVLLAFGGAWAIHAGRSMLESWQSATVKIPIPLVSVDLGMNFVDLLHVRPILNDLVYWDERLWLAFAILWLGPWIAWIIAGTLFGVLLGAIYNLIGKMGGGMRVTLTPAATPVGGPSYPPASWQGGAPQAPPGGWQGPPGPQR